MNDFLARLAERTLGHVPVLEPLALRFARGTLSLGPLREPARTLAELPMRYRARGRALFSLPRQDVEHGDVDSGSAWATSPGHHVISHGVRAHGETSSNAPDGHADVLMGTPSPVPEPRLFRQLVASEPGEAIAVPSSMPDISDDRYEANVDEPAAWSEGVTWSERRSPRAREPGALLEPATLEHVFAELPPAPAAGHASAGMTPTMAALTSEAGSPLQPASREPAVAQALVPSHDDEAAMADSQREAAGPGSRVAATSTTAALLPAGQRRGESTPREPSMVQSESADMPRPLESLAVLSPAGAPVRPRPSMGAPTHLPALDDTLGTDAPGVTSGVMRTAPPHGGPVMRAAGRQAAGASQERSPGKAETAALPQPQPPYARALPSSFTPGETDRDESPQERLPGKAETAALLQPQPPHARALPSSFTPGETDRDESSQERLPGKAETAALLQPQPPYARALPSPSTAGIQFRPRPGVMREMLYRSPSSGPDAVRTQVGDAVSQAASVRLGASTSSRDSTRPDRSRSGFASSEILARDAGKPEALRAGSTEASPDMPVISPDMPVISHEPPPVVSVLQRRAVPGHAFHQGHPENGHGNPDLLDPAASLSLPPRPGTPTSPRVGAVPELLAPSPSRADSAAMESHVAVPGRGIAEMRANTSADKSIRPDSGRTDSRALAYRLRTIMRRTLHRGDSGAAPASDFHSGENEAGPRSVHAAKSTQPRQAAHLSHSAMPLTPASPLPSPVPGTATPVALPSHSPAPSAASPAPSAASPASSAASPAPSAASPAPSAASLAAMLLRSPISGSERTALHSPVTLSGEQTAASHANSAAIRAVSRQIPTAVRALQRMTTGAAATAGTHLVITGVHPGPRRGDSPATRSVRSPSGPAPTGDPGHVAVHISGARARTSSTDSTAEAGAPRSLVPSGQTPDLMQALERRGAGSSHASENRVAPAHRESMVVHEDDVAPGASKIGTSAAIPPGAHLPNDSRAHREKAPLTDSRPASSSRLAQTRQARAQQARALQPRTTPRRDTGRGSSGPAPKADDASEPLVRVRIGQITVHAASPPPPARAPARPKQPILSLSDYLRSREEARS
jgi:hypothetical protein